jgi:hypothetical protein
VTKTVSRSAKLPALKFDPTTLEMLVNKLLSTMFIDGKPSLSIVLRTYNHTYDFDSIGDLKNNLIKLPNVVSNVSIAIYDYTLRRHCHLSRSFSHVAVSAESNNDTWCVDVINVFKLFSTENKSWYSFIKIWMLWIVATALCTLSVVYVVKTNNVYFIIVAVFCFLTNILSSWFFDDMLPPTKMIIRNESSFFKKYTSEISAISAIIILALTIIITVFTVLLYFKT